MAHHFSEAESVLGSEKTAEYAVLAGEQSLQSNAFEEAEYYFRRAVRSSRNRPADQLTARMFGGLGFILTNSELPSVRQKGWDFLSSAFDLFLRFEAIDRAVAVAETPVAMVGLRGTVDVTARALDVLEKDSLRYGYLLARHAVALKEENGDFENDLSCLERSLNIARKHEDKRLEARIMLHYGQHFAALRDYESTITYCRRAIALAKETGDESVEVRACRSSADAYLSIFDFDNALLVQGQNLELAKRLRVPTTLSFAGEIEFDTARYTGDWARAIEIAESERDRTGNEELHRHRTNLIEHYLTEASDEQVRADVMVTESYDIRSEILVLAVASWLAARDTTYLDLLASFVPESTSADTKNELLMMVAHGIWSITNNNVEYAHDAYEKLSHLTGQWEIHGGVAIDHILGLLAAVVGRDEAEIHFNTAANLCDQAGYSPEIAINSCDHAEFLIKRGNHRDLVKARTLLADAKDIATDKGMEPLKRRVSSLTESIDTAHAKYPDGLSEREAEILRLVAYGLSNQQIADRLVLSRHTVIRHVANIYAKINASNRVQATKYAHDHEIDLIPHNDTAG
jgi:DNA-binding CsgD family transcriptional regulator